MNIYQKIHFLQSKHLSGWNGDFSDNEKFYIMKQIKHVFVLAIYKRLLIFNALNAILAFAFIVSSLYCALRYTPMFLLVSILSSFQFINYFSSFCVDYQRAFRFQNRFRKNKTIKELKK